MLAVRSRGSAARPVRRFGAAVLICARVGHCTRFDRLHDDFCSVSRITRGKTDPNAFGRNRLPSNGELPQIIHADEAEAIVGVFETLFELRFPIEEMRIVTSADLEADPTGDTNNTSSFVCRAVTGGSRFSEHAFGLAIDVNPFHNPYIKGDLVLPELASSYLERGTGLPGMIDRGSPVIEAFARIGWEWGGDWNSLKDYQHFSLNNR